LLVPCASRSQPRRQPSGVADLLATRIYPGSTDATAGNTDSANTAAANTHSANTAAANTGASDATAGSVRHVHGGGPGEQRSLFGRNWRRAWRRD